MHDDLVCCFCNHPIGKKDKVLNISIAAVIEKGEDTSSQFCFSHVKCMADRLHQEFPFYIGTLLMDEE
jgi:hypothetical protein